MIAVVAAKIDHSITVANDIGSEDTDNVEIAAVTVLIEPKIAAKTETNPEDIANEITAIAIATESIIAGKDVADVEISPRPHISENVPEHEKNRSNIQRLATSTCNQSTSITSSL